MSDNNKTYRVRTSVGEGTDSLLNVSLTQDIKTIEILSLNVGLENAYKLQSANYGCIAGRVLANGNFGIPNAKISIFVEATQEDLENPILAELYPYKNTWSKNTDGTRYNLLPEDPVNDCHRPVGTFPSKRLVLDDNNVLEIFDKYYKYTTVTNQSGDYLIFGVPTGNNIVHTDIDISDIGILSQKPIDLQYKGYNKEMFENSQMFKTDTNIDNLAQIISQNDSVFVYPFWGENDEIGISTANNVKITRHDINIQYKFEPTCIFLGSIMTDDSTQGISRNCIPSNNMGLMKNMKTSEGTIEMIRKKSDGSIEQIAIQGDQLINGDGIWCYQIPMNLDYVMTDEYGNTVPTDNPNKGIPTRTSVRFRLSLNGFENDFIQNHLCKVLIPNNPKKIEDLDYQFGSDTKESSFKDLLWNKVYTVKSYIPRIQNLDINWLTKFTGIKDVADFSNDRNPMPYNNIRVNLNFMFGLMCAIMKFMIWTAGFVNRLISLLQGSRTIRSLIPSVKDLSCIKIGDGACPDMEGWYFAPNCTGDSLRKVYNELTDGEGNEDKTSIDYENQDNSRICVTSKTDFLFKCVEINLALQYNVIQFNFYNDWINGTIYTPRWFMKAPKVSKFIVGGAAVKSKINACMDTRVVSRRLVQSCPIVYERPDYGNKNFYTKVSDNVGIGCSKNKTYINGYGELIQLPNISTAVKSGGGILTEKQACHKVKAYVNVFKNGALIHQQPTNQNKYVYYVKPCEWNDKLGGKKVNLFATDIVLLGSMNENDIDGIPQTFKRIPTTSYIMPQNNLVSTNLDSGLLLGSQNGESICNGTTENPVSKTAQTLASYKLWNKTNQYAMPDDDISDTTSAITEESGIDWGETGPGQGSNKPNKLYLPGGHFLGVSCMNTEVNIKSCINLYRACEIGSSLSSREEISYGDNPEAIKTGYIVPTGLISGNNVIDKNVRSEFATLNHLGLQTKDDDFGYKKYEFYPLFPINFNGELYKYTNSEDSEYKKLTSSNGEYRRVIEYPSDDYYIYRFGLIKNTENEYSDEDIRAKYLGENNDEVTFPMYENSFYFYFGLKSGLTALDKFYKDYFSECNDKGDRVPSVQINVTGATFCAGNGENGVIEVITNKFINPTITITNTNNGVVKTVTGDTKCRFEGLIGDTYYNVTVVGNNSMEEKTVKVELDLPYEITNFINRITTSGFTKSYFYNPSDSSTTITADGNGYIQFGQNSLDGINDIIVYNKTNYKVVKGSADNFTAYTINRNEVLLNGVYDTGSTTLYAWKGNSEYNIAVIANCTTNAYVLPSQYYIAMPGEFSLCCYNEDYNLRDFYGKVSHDSSEINFERWIGNDGGRPWWVDCLASDSQLSDIEKWAVRKSITAQSSLYTLSQYAIGIYPIYGSAPYSYTNRGHKERIFLDDSGNTIVTVNSGEYVLPTMFNVPTHNVPIYVPNVNFFRHFFLLGVNTTGSTDLFETSVKDSENNRIDIEMPYIYEPFFFNMVSNMSYSRTPTEGVKQGYFDLSILNGINEKPEDGFNCNINGISFNIGITYTGLTQYDITVEKMFTIANHNSSENELIVNSGSTSTITISENVTTNNEVGSILYEKIPQLDFTNIFDSNIKYFLVPNGKYTPTKKFTSCVKNNSGDVRYFDYTDSAISGNYTQWPGCVKLSQFNVVRSETEEDLNAELIVDFEKFKEIEPTDSHYYTYVVLGVYDPWSTEDTEMFISNYCKKRDTNEYGSIELNDDNEIKKWETVFPHTNSISVICRYGLTDFINIVKSTYGE